MEHRFHRAARTWPGYRWWKLPLTGLIGGFFYVVLNLWIFLAFAIASPSGFGSVVDDAAELDLTDPAIFALSMVSIIALIPALMLATLIVGPKPRGLFWSVEGRLRWRWLGRMFALALVVHAVMFTAIFSLTAAFTDGEVVAPQTAGDKTVLLVVLVLVLVPFQATAEEYVFRGYLMQLIGGWLKQPAFAILLPVPLFVIGHAYDAWGLLDVAIFGITAGLLSWMTGGIEAAIATHVVNNIVLFCLGSVGVIDINSTQGSVWGVLGTLVTSVIFVTLVQRQSARTGLVVTRDASPPVDNLTISSQWVT